MITLFFRLSHFIFGKASVQILGFITFPILTRTFSKQEYGVLGLLMTTMLLCVAIAKAGLSEGVTRFYEDHAQSPEALKTFTSTVIARALLFSGAAAVLYYFAVPFFLKLFAISSVFTTSFRIMAIYLFFRPLNIAVMNFLKVTGKTVLLNALNLFLKALAVALSLFFLFSLEARFSGYLIGIVLAEGALAIIFFGWFLNTFPIDMSHISGGLTLSLIKFGMPLLLTEMFFLLLSYADRYFILAFRTEAELGLYTVGYNLAMYVSNIITLSLSYAVVPIYVQIFKNSGRTATETFLNRCLHYIVPATVCICAMFLAVSQNLITMLASEQYALAAAFSPLILIGSLFLGLNYLVNAGLYLKNKSMTICLIFFVSLLSNVMMNILFIPPFGITGAAYATLLSCAMSFIMTLSFSSKYISLRISLGHLLFYLLTATMMFFAMIKIDLSTHYTSISVKLFVGLAIASVAFGFKEKEIRSKALAIFQRRKLRFYPVKN